MVPCVQRWTEKTRSQKAKGQHAPGGTGLGEEAPGYGAWPSCVLWPGYRVPSPGRGMLSGSGNSVPSSPSLRPLLIASALSSALLARLLMVWYDAMAGQDYVVRSIHIVQYLWIAEQGRGRTGECHRDVVGYLSTLPCSLEGPYS